MELWVDYGKNSHNGVTLRIIIKIAKSARWGKTNLNNELVKIEPQFEFKNVQTNYRGASKKERAQQSHFQYEIRPSDMPILLQYPIQSHVPGWPHHAFGLSSLHRGWGSKLTRRTGFSFHPPRIVRNN